MRAGIEKLGVRWKTVTLLGLPGDQGDRLDARGAGSDHGDTSAGEVDAVVGPATGEVDVTAEPVHPGDVRRLRHGQAAAGHDVPAAGDGLAGVGGHRPPVTPVVPVGGGDAGTEHDVATEVVAVGHVPQIGQDLRLGRVLLGPGPLGLELGVEAEGVVGGGDVAAGTRVAVPVPGATDVAGRVVGPGHESEAAQPVQQVQTGEPGPDHHHVDVGRVVPRAVRQRLFDGRLPPVARPHV